MLKFKDVNGWSYPIVALQVLFMAFCLFYANLCAVTVHKKNNVAQI